MRRVCFDTGSDYYWDGRRGFLNEPSQARACFKDRKFKFYAATTFDSHIRRFTDFTDPQSLLSHLQSADEIVTFNGRTCDLIVLESVLGREAMDVIWRKPHHDLRGWKAFSLKDSVGSQLPRDVASSFEEVENQRRHKTKKSCDNEFISGKLGNTYRDTRFTYALFLKYLKSGSSEYTFHDL